MASAPTEPVANLVDIEGLAAALEQFAEERNWQQFHSPKNLVMALSGEVGELSDIFQWMTQDESKAAARDPQTAHNVREELADVLLYLVRLASVLGVDLNQAAADKLTANARKYPVALVYGSSRKPMQGA